MMPLHMSTSMLGIPLTIVDDNARLPSEDLLEQSCVYRMKRRTSGNSPALVKLIKTKPSRWDAIPTVNKKLSLPPSHQNISLNEAARLTLRAAPVRWVDDTVLHNAHKPLRRPTRSSNYADAATLLELALSEMDFSESDDVSFAVNSLAATV